ncbi:hypothetical protein [Pseudonocardia xishanensis]|uniref:Lipoprotein LprG n=1 Tax=Pseudonocardia xishanensis TaxID=630995 RepID=A0ABP8RVJ1_9PSEU
MRERGRGQGKGAGTLVLIAFALLAVLASVVSCARGNSDETVVPGLPKYYATADLLTAVSTRRNTDRTAVLRLTGQLDAAGTPAEVVGDGALRVEQGGGVSARFTQTVTVGGRAQSSAMVVRPGGQVFQQVAGVWTRIDEAPTGTTEKQWATVAVNLTDTADPTANLAHFREAALVADAVDDTVAGMPAVRYLVVVDLVRAADQEPDPAVRAALTEQVQRGLTRISSTLWIDAANRPLRSESRQTLPGLGELTVTADYRDWGTPVSIPEPEATT